MVSTAFLVGLAALLASTVLAQYGVDTIDLTTTMTVYSCSSEVESCPGRSVASYPASAPPSLTATLTTSYVNIPTLSTVVIAPPPTTYPTTSPIPVHSSTISSAEYSIYGSESSSVAAPVQSYSSVGSGGSGPIIYSTTMTAPSLPNSLTSILFATGYPTSSITSVVSVKPSGTSSIAGASPSASPTSGAGERLVLSYSIALGVMALSVCLLG